ncbi:MAG: hypothetical protein V4488_14780 [Pseudomonadota bacterium]
MNTKLAKICFIALFFCSQVSVAQNTANSRYIWVGDLTLNSLHDFSDALKNSKMVTAIEFRKSSGAAASAGIIVKEIESQIEMKKLKTFARGQCASACANAFLLGEERTLLPSMDTTPTHLMLHAQRSNQTGEINYGATDQLFKKIVAKSKGKITLAFLEKMYEAKNSGGGLYILREAKATNDGISQIFFCTGEEKELRRPCEAIKGLKPQDLGISIAE